LQGIDLDRLDCRLREQQVNNRYDRRMVLETINFANHDLHAWGCNVFKWAVATIREGNASEAYRALTGISAIGDKLATFYLRDVVLVEGIEAQIRGADYCYFQPVDTWVEQVARSLWTLQRADLGRTLIVKRKLIEACLAAGVSPLLFNVGAWMVGANAYRLLLEML